MNDFENDIEIDDDNDFDELLLDKRLTDILKALSKVSDTLNNNNSKLDIQSFLNSNKALIESFLSKLKDIQQQELPAPNVNVQVNQSEVITSIEKLSNQIIDSLKSLEQAITNMNEQKPKTWEFKITERNNGFAQKIVATSK
jgi:hypothetical protein